MAVIRTEAPSVVISSGSDDETGLVVFESKQVGRDDVWTIRFRLTEFQLRCLAKQAEEASDMLQRRKPMHPPGTALIDPRKVED